MKGLIIRLLARLGLVTMGRYKALAMQLRDAEARGKKLSTLLEEVRAESRDWKLKANEAVKQLKVDGKDASHAVRHAEKLKVEADRLRADIDRIHATNGELEALRTRVAEAERELTIAREQLMAVEVKLDILEGAANVLDERTRSVITARVGERGTPV